MRHDPLAERPKVGGIAEQLADLHREVGEQLRQHGRVVQHPVLELRERAAAEVLLGLREPPLDRGHRVPPEVVVVLAGRSPRAGA